MKIKIVLLSVIMGLSGVSQAALYDRGGGMIYDDVLDITWLQDANMDGSMSWSDSVAWADGLSFGGYDDWRLVSMDANGDSTVVNCSTASEMACRDNELGYMFYHNLMGSVGIGLPNQGLFSNIQSIHWSSTPYVFTPGDGWIFRFSNGGQDNGNPNNLNGAWAVRAGDVAVVPLPAAIWMMIGGLGALAGLRRK